MQLMGMAMQSLQQVMRIEFQNKEYLERLAVDLVKKEMGRISKFETKQIQLNKNILHPDTLKFIENKRNAPGYEKRVGYQKDKVRKSGMNSLAIVPKDEPIIFTFKNGKYALEEGWHRTLALLDMLEDKEFKTDSVPVNAIIAYAK
jgi:hypothetical protein